MSVVLVCLGAGAAVSEDPTCDYEIAPTDTEIDQLVIDVSCDPALQDAGFQSRSDSKYWRMESSADGRNTTRFLLDLGSMAHELDDFRKAMPYGRGILVAPAHLLPLPRKDGAIVLKVRFSIPEGALVTSMSTAPDGSFALTSSDIDEAGPVILGTGIWSEPVASDRAMRLILPEDGFYLSRQALMAWASAAIQANRRFWGQSPVSNADVIFVPAKGRSGVPFGRVTSEGGVVITVLVGAEADGEDLYDDWVLIHELLHLGSPVMRDKGSWLNEGISTFYEPLLRAQAGWKSEDDVWREWISQMPRGMRAMTEIGLSNAGRGGIYWGGAIFVLLAEIEALTASHGTIKFSDCLRRALAMGGNVMQRWPTAKLIGICDGMLGGDRLSGILSAHSDAGAPLDLPGIWKRLGVAMAEDGKITYDDGAELAWLRPLIIWGGLEKPQPISSMAFRNPD